LAAASVAPAWSADPAPQGPFLQAPGGTSTPTAPAVAPNALPGPAVRSAPTASSAITPPAPITPPPTSQPIAQPQGHPLEPVLELLRQSHQAAQGIHDYSCTLMKRELLGGKLSEHESVALKVRVKPFSVYIYCLGPVEPKGQEVLYVEGRNNNQALAHTTGLRDRLVGTLSLDPKSSRMMERNRHPVTEIGIHHLLDDALASCQSDLNFGECDVKYYRGAKVDSRECLCVQVTHPVPRKNFRYHVTRIYFDQQLNVPIRFEGYTWPTQAGGQPALLEEYTYRNLSVNRGLTDADFDPRNPSYKFN
jgi:hypothetical protein